MRRFKLYWIFLIGLFIISVSEAKTIPRPPKSDEIPVITQNYLKQIYDNFNKLEVVITNPDGAIKGNFGDILLFNNSGTYYIEVCVSSPNGTVWKGIVLTDTP